MHIIYPFSEIFCVFKLSFRLNTLFKTNYNLKKTVIVRQTLTQHELSWHCFDKKVDYKKTIDNFLTVKSQSLLQLMKNGLYWNCSATLWCTSCDVQTFLTILCASCTVCILLYPLVQRH